jgi:hypothetical protein
MRNQGIRTGHQKGEGQQSPGRNLTDDRSDQRQTGGRQDDSERYRQKNPEHGKQLYEDDDVKGGRNG